MSLRIQIAAVLCVGGAAMAGAGSRSPMLAQAPLHPIFSAREELIVLHVKVQDKKRAYVSSLPANAFSISEDGQPQAIQVFMEQDAPATVGLLIDSSASMLDAYDRVVAAVSSFVDTSNPKDEIFALAFTETVRATLPPSQPFTNDAAVLRASLDVAIPAHSRTALYDAVAAGLEQLDRGTRQRKVLVVVSDGGDNASTATFDEVLRRAQTTNTVIYGIAIAAPDEPDATPKRLKAIAEASGGEAFEPRDVTAVAEVFDRISRDIRNAYTIGYSSTNAKRDGRFRRIRVVAKAPDGRPLVVRTRKGYAW